MEKMPQLTTEWMHLILHICLLCAATVKVKPAAVYKGCPVSCICSRDDLVPGAWALRADCNHVQKMPQLTRNITTLCLDAAPSIGPFAFSNAPLLRRIYIYAKNLITIDKDAFQSLPKLLELDISLIRKPSRKFPLFRHLVTLESLKLIRLGFQRIPSEMLCEASHLKHLSLEGNEISSVRFDQCVSTAWTRFSSLSLGFNPLEIIQAEDFQYLKDHNVTKLYLYFCRLTGLQPGLFQHLPRLTLLDLSRNQITVLLPGVFDYLSNLRDLIIEYSYLISPYFRDNYTFIPVLQRFAAFDLGLASDDLWFPRIFLSATSLSSVDIVTYTTTLHDATFANLIRSPVTNMTLWLSHITQVSSAAFDPLQSLQELLLNGWPKDTEVLYNMSLSLGRLPLLKLCVITSAHAQALDNRTFGGFPPNNSLVHLDISDSQIEKIGWYTFQYFKQLRSLNLSNNRLTDYELELSAFGGLDSLHTLDLSHNQLQQMHGDRGEPPSLRTLILTGNEIDLLFFTTERWSNITQLYLGHNIIKGLNRFTFKGFDNLELLDLRWNNIESVSFDTFWDTPSLKQLFLEGNHIVELTGSIFQNNDFLEHVDLRRNPLCEQSAYVFRNLPRLKVLKLSGGKFPVLQDIIFKNNHMLKTLYLDDSYIISWRPEVFRPLRNLTYLSMADNTITDVPETAFTYLTSLAYLDLSGNPLACTCELLWFKSWISTSNVYLVDYTIRERYTCSSPVKERKRPLIDFQLTVEDCTSHFLLKVVMGSVFGFFCVCTVLSLAHRFRWYIRYYIFLVRSRRRQMYDTLVDDETFKYDVYVCYHNSSRRWVITELLPKLENEAGIKLCLHDRNWLAGPTIMDNIIESIEQSRKTLLLVNNGFAQSGWCREETSLAYHRLIETQRNMLVVVLLENVQQENMDRLLRSILTKRVYLKYSQSKKKEHRFWKALKAALRKGEHPAAGMELHKA